VGDLHDRLRHALHLSGEPVPFGSNPFVLRPHAAICFERLQGLDPLGKLLPGFVQTIPRERSVLQFATRKLDVVAGKQWVQRARSRLSFCSLSGFGGRLDFRKQSADID
jgi:hypothetical protein